MKSKRCNKCGEEKPLSEFYKSKRTKDGHEGSCKVCRSARAKENEAKNRDKRLAYMKEYHKKNKEKRAAYRKEYYKKNKEKRAAYHKAYYSDPENKLKREEYNLMRNYGLTLKDKEQMIKDQGGGCKLCHVDLDSTAKPVVDHNHITGEVRGILCSRCNVLLGLINADEGTKFALKVVKFIKENK